MAAIRKCERCGASSAFEVLAYRDDKLVCQQCDCDMEQEWASADPENRRHYLDTFSPCGDV